MLDDAPTVQPQQPFVQANPADINYHYHYPTQCNCGCNQLRERVAVLEQNLYQLTLILNNKEKAGEMPQPTRRFIGDTEAAQ